jgi:hypothetical protein
MLSGSVQNISQTFVQFALHFCGVLLNLRQPKLFAKESLEGFKVGEALPPLVPRHAT